ncbi:hypothetical protein Tco_0417768 [Tanacetum coccineum]
MMCRRQEYMIRDMEHKCVTADKFWKVHGKVDQVLHEIVPQLAERATNDFIEGNLKRVVADTVIQERDAFQADVPALISKEFDAQSPQIIEELFKTYVQNNVIQVHPTTSTSTETTSSGDLQQQSDDAFHSQRHDDHQEDNTPPKGGENSEKTQDVQEFKIHAKLFPKADLEEKMNRWVRKEFKNFNEDTRLSIQHWKDSWHKRVYNQNQRKVRDSLEDYFSNNRITEFVRIITDQQYGLDYMEQILVMRENDKPSSFSKADFKYLNKNDIKDLYYLFRNK